MTSRQQLAALLALLTEEEAGAALDGVERARAGDAWRARFRPLPSCRRNVTQHAHIAAEHSVFITAGFYPGGAVGEVDIEIHKQGAPLRGAFGGLARVLSVSLQHGVPLAPLAGELAGIRCEPAGHVEGHPTIRSALSIPDYLGRALLAMGGA